MTDRAETQLVAALLAGRDLEAASRVKSEDFADERAGKIWAAGLRLLDEGLEVSLLGLETALADPSISLDRIALYDSPHTTPADIAESAKSVIAASRRRQVKRLCLEIARRIDEAEEPGQALVDEAIDRLSAISTTGTEDALVSLHEAMARRVEQIRARQRGETHRCTTGLRSLDTFLHGGLGPGWQVVIGARPKMGKSALALQLAIAAAAAGGPVLFFSHEMSDAEIGGRGLSAMGDVDLERLEERLEVGEWNRMIRAAERAQKWRFDICDRPVGITRLCAIARRWRRANPEGIGMIVVDYLQLVEGERGRNTNREQEIGSMSRRLKNQARQLGCVSLALSQLNRDVEKRKPPRPMLADLRESGSIEQDADLVLLLYRPWVYDDTKPRQDVDTIVAANRHGPMPWTLPMRFIDRQARFEDA
jgi:replicative DNA helicase